MDGIKMKLILVMLVVGLLAWKLSPELQSWAAVQLSNPKEVSKEVSIVVTAPKPVSAPFKCDGRKYCSQMTSCAEAKNFLKNCPGMKMDGDNDAIPCESQWCQSLFVAQRESLALPHVERRATSRRLTRSRLRASSQRLVRDGCPALQ